MFDIYLHGKLHITCTQNVISHVSIFYYVTVYTPVELSKSISLFHFFYWYSEQQSQLLAKFVCNIGFEFKLDVEEMQYLIEQGLAISWISPQLKLLGINNLIF